MPALCLLATVGGCASSPGRHSQDSTRPEPPAQAHEVAVVRKPEHLQLANFSVLRGVPEGIPQEVTRAVHADTSGANWTLAQRLPTIDPAVWAVPGRKHLCLVELPSNGAIGVVCTRTRYAIQRSAYTASVPPPGSSTRAKRVILGLVPNSVRAVRVYTAGLPPERASMSQNFFFLEDEVHRPPTSVKLIH